MAGMLDKAYKGLKGLGSRYEQMEQQALGNTKKKKKEEKDKKKNGKVTNVKPKGY